MKLSAVDEEILSHAAPEERAAFRTWWDAQWALEKSMRRTPALRPKRVGTDGTEYELVLLSECPGPPPFWTWYPTGKPGKNGTAPKDPTNSADAKRIIDEWACVRSPLQ